MNQGGKHGAGEPTHPENKRERRRGAAGRAAVLRRAPSDSDCSGETASLSADSGDRAPRPVPLAPPRSGKTRSRRRGSEWEVLEGLKDGQRFEKRPDVFNGYLHKKRKWPLKGWHKRFFVVDGGILVYARSPTDVARGRLHGSVDVGLSVISAKARRRRIDIDADEFIYHLRAKTPDVFRTWLNVLKAHRLYRQHLLTFGARESIPKIHAPLDDLPPTDTSSRTSFSTNTSSSSQSVVNTIIKSPIDLDPSVYSNKDKSSILNWQLENLSSSSLNLTPLKFDTNDFNFRETFKHRSCSMNCIARRFLEKVEDVKKLIITPPDSEKQMTWTDLEYSPQKDQSIESQKNTDTKWIKKPYKIVSNESPTYSSPFLKLSPQPTPCYFFSRKKQTSKAEVMKKSRKCTNLVKYRNLAVEPPLKTFSSKCMLLRKNKLPPTKQAVVETTKINETVKCETLNKSHEKQVKLNCQENKSSQNASTLFDYDKISENIITSIFNQKFKTNVQSSQHIKNCIDQIIKDLYDIKLDQNVHPVKTLFRNLLEYWLKNTSMSTFKDALKNDKSISSPSNKHFTKDENLSSFQIKRITKETQSISISDAKLQLKTTKSNYANTPKNVKEKKAIYKQKLQPPITASPRRDTESFEKERRIQELERLLKNTVYICETSPNNVNKEKNTKTNLTNKEKDIKITKKLIQNLNHLNKISDCPNTNEKPVQDYSSSSAELPEIQDTIKHLINETSLPADIATEFLGAYLDVLLQNSNTTTSLKCNTTTTSQSTDWSKEPPNCDVIAEPVIKKVSKSIITSNVRESRTNVQKPKAFSTTEVDPGQKYLKDILDKVTTIFTKVKKIENNAQQQNSKEQNKVSKPQESGTPAIASKKDLIVQNDDRSLLIKLSKLYNLENIALSKDSTEDGGMLINIKLKEKTSNSNENKLLVGLNFEEIKLNKDLSGTGLSFSNCDDSPSDEIFCNSPRDPELGFNIEQPIDLKPYTSSDGTSNAYRNNQSYNSVDPINRNSLNMDRENNDPQSCYIMSFKKCRPNSELQKKSKTSDANTDQSSSKAFEATKPEVTISEKSPKVIDETFILLLLENLTLLSRNVPTLHKDLQALYSKLKKKHEKQVKVNPTGLSLLGKIYNEDRNDDYDRGTQFDPNITSTKQKETIGINTSTPNVKEQYVETKTKITDSVAQTYKTYMTVPDKPSMENMKIADTELVNIKSLEQSTDQPICGKETNDCGTNTDFHVLSVKKLTNTTIKRNLTNFKETRKRRNTPQLRDLMKEISLLSPGVNVSIESQTEKLSFEKDFKVCQFSVKNELKKAVSMSTVSSDELKTLYRCTSEPSYCSGLFSPTTPTLRGPQAGFVSGTPGGRLAGWIIESGGPLESASRSLGQAQLSVQQLQRLLDALELQHQMHHDTDVSIEGASPNVKKDRRKFGLRKKKSNSKCASVELAPPHIDPSSSHTALSSLSALTAPPSPGGGASSVPNSAASLPIACAAARPQSLPGAESLNTAPGPASLTSLTPDHQLREDFTVLAKDLVASLKGIVSTMVCERGRLRAAMEAAESTATPGNAVMAALRTNLTSALQQNSELRTRLSRIHDASDIAEICSVANSDAVNRHIQQSLSYSSSCVSASEFFDAEEHEDDLKVDDDLPADEAGVIELDGDSSSEAGSLSSEEGSASSDNSDGAMLSAEQVTLVHNGPTWTRRTRLPAPRPEPGGPSLWNLLYKNIGKDLSQISMPVTINEPLNMLQRLCEELEYSELLDSAAECKSSVERMCLIAAFAVSAYASSAHRAASKPFNPLLAETYECVRDDRGFRFLAEQVSHHPPISACHAESPRWCFWQEARIKTKFWGKSMEFQPTGRVHVRLNTTGDHYTWNKVTTCVHNLFGGQRWVDQYGDMHIVCVGTDISCKLNFIKASSWSASRHEVRGAVCCGSSRVRLAGRWSEALYAGDPPAARCLWRPGAMPPEHELYYGFTRFAMELNEIEPGMRELLPHTDTRFRPDQRSLEEGDVQAAEQYKHELEQAQRERRRESPNHTPAWFRKTLEDGSETWLFSGEYWKAREAGFSEHVAPRIW